MANIKGMNVTGQKVTPNAYGIHERGKYTGSITGMNVTQNSTPNMSVMVAVGTAVLTKNTNSSVTAILDTPTNITIATASTANPRIDTLVVYEDLSVTMPSAEPYSIDAANGRFKIVSIAGTPGTSPVAPNDAAIQSAIGGANTSWARICTVRVEKSTTTIINSKIDNSVKIALSSVLAPGAVGTNQIANLAVGPGKVDFTTFPLNKTIKLQKTTNQPITATTQTIIAFDSAVSGYDTTLFEFSTSYSGGAGVKIVSNKVKSIVLSYSYRTNIAVENYPNVVLGGVSICESMIAGQFTIFQNNVVIPVNLNDIIQIRNYFMGAVTVQGDPKFSYATISVHEYNN